MVDGTGLENRRGVKPTVSSNLTLSARKKLELFLKSFWLKITNLPLPEGFFVGPRCMKKVRILFLLNAVYLYKHHKKYGTFCYETNKSLIRLICLVYAFVITALSFR